MELGFSKKSHVLELSFADVSLDSEDVKINFLTTGRVLIGDSVISTADTLNGEQLRQVVSAVMHTV